MGKQDIYIYEKSESPLILACGPHFLSFSLSVMTRCGTHALVRCVTNEGVLTFRCFPSKSQLQNILHLLKKKTVSTLDLLFATHSHSVVLSENIHLH